MNENKKVETGLDFDAIRAELNDQPWIDDAGGVSETRSVFLGTVFALLPSGKFYAAFASGNVDDDEIKEDAAWRETVEAELEKLGMYFTTGEGDPCDLFASEYREAFDDRVDAV